MARSNGFTPTQRAMLEVLSDGKGHHPTELRDCLPDPLGPVSNIWPHLSYLRKKLRPRGEDILCYSNGGRKYYIHVRLIAQRVDV